jgi:hypothetical protein
MKKLSLILTAAILSFSLSSFAGESEADRERRNIKDQIFDLVDLSNHSSEGVVTVYFEIGYGNEIIVHQIDSSNEELTEYVQNCLDNGTLTVGDGSKGKVYAIDLHFYVL